MNNSFYPCLWFNNNAKEAADFYCNVFPATKITANSPIVVSIEMEGQKFMLLNGGDHFKVNPSISFMVIRNSASEVEELWNKLIGGGIALMALDTYPWSPKYGWLQDKFGVSWQLYTNKEPVDQQNYVPTLMFTGKQNGRAEEAINFYTSVFPGSGVQGIMKYGEGGGDTPGNVQHAQFNISGYTLMCMDSTGPHDFDFNEGVSLVVECATQQQIDNYWNQLISDGGEESMCGWLKDRFGVSWQIVPVQLSQLMSKGNAERSGKMMNALMKMKKLDIAQLEAAYNS